MAFSMKDATGTTVVRKTTVDSNAEHTAHIIVDSQPVPSALIFGQVNTSAANPQQLPANTVISEVSVKALPTNTGVVYLGGAGVLASTGWELAAGAEVKIKISNTNALYVLAAVAGESIAFIGG